MNTHWLVYMVEKDIAKSARERIVDAASRLFYSEGIRAVSVDAIAEQAATTKKTLYYHFRSKDDLVAEYLSSRDQPNLILYEKWFTEAPGGLPDKVEAMFKGVAAAARNPRWRGCAFLRTAGELANLPGHPAMKIGAAHKKKFESWLAERLGHGGVEAGPVLARQVMLLMDGAFSTMLVHRDPSYCEEAGRTAAWLVSSAKKKGPSGSETNLSQI